MTVSFTINPAKAPAERPQTPSGCPPAPVRGTSGVPARISLIPGPRLSLEWSREATRGVAMARNDRELAAITDTLRAVIKERGLTYATIAAEIGVSERTIKRLVAGSG